MKRLFLLLLFLIFIPEISNAEVDRFVFITDIQTLKPNTISSAITIQSQNNSGSEENVLETMDIVFSSTSQTGEFLNSSGSAVSKTMSKNTANRTFYYRDSQNGEHTIKVSVTGRDSQKNFSASQKITIGDSVSAQTNNTSNATNQTQSSQSSNTESQSAHSSPAPTSGSKDIFDFEVSAGRDRFTAVGSEITFQVTPIKLNGIQQTNINYSWTMGDGVKKDGIVINHKYRFPGEYNVILNASASDRTAVSRLKVLVIEPVLELSIDNKGVVVFNKSKGEINLGEFVLESGVYRFIFPKDTIIGQNQKLILGKELFNFMGDNIILKNPLGNEVININLKPQNQILENLFIATSTEIIVNKVESNEPLKKSLVSYSVKNQTSQIAKPKIIDEVATNTTVIYTAKSKPQKMTTFFSWFKNIFSARQ